MASTGQRFADRRQEIVAVASGLLNSAGAQGLRLADVAGAVGLDISSLGHYFPKKDDLVATCLERTIAWLEDAVATAAARPDERSRADRLIEAQLALYARQRLGEAPLAMLSDLPSLADEARKPLESHLSTTMRTMSEFFPIARGTRSRAEQLLASNILASTVFWLPAWQGEYAARDFDRVRGTLLSLFDDGFILAAGPAVPIRGAMPAAVDAEPASRFLSAATHLINRLGHKGARVEKIAAELGVSPGSFYHHIRTKNDLVVACFERSFDVVEAAFDAADRSPSGSVANIRDRRAAPRLCWDQAALLKC